MSGSEALEFFPNRNRIRAYLIATGVMLLVSILIMLNLEALQYGLFRLIAMIIAFFGVLGFGYGFLFNVLRVQRPKALISATPDHLSFHVSPLSFGSCEWDNIASYSLVRYARQKWIRVELEHPDAMIRATKGIVRRRLRANLKRFGTPFVLPANLLPEDAEEVLKALQGYGKEIA